MTKFNERYSWKAEGANGNLIVAGGDLKGAVRFSLIPSAGTGLPRHDLVGVKMIRRFGRGFVRGMGGGLREYVQCVVCENFRFWVGYSDGTVLISPVDFELYL
jgi:hypothetical protein